MPSCFPLHQIAELVEKSDRHIILNEIFVKGTLQLFL